ncbi:MULTISPECIES: PAP/fibrillin family protein [unclassified Leptolyngbya]|uniref:PAP/fibrillin family protein n=1 Tax=unclassified Leptolyngbya TaxID=2650499 RepID=UPI001683CD84|nr:MULTISPECIES: PAP/fibrillin family protein [unclassified Leptolyngbya]MBD1913502.1 PAP/fibrillin family protein [Leptolyngbya sp. FACHB-8]MBD2153276.1 PAP/fibrillin family protein [Leptolyngbya sp. FACHB-16]
MIGKTRLLEAIAGKNRGILASKPDQQAILAAVAQLEDHNPTPRPLEAPEKLDGNWQLLYTTSQELLGIDRFALLKLGQIYQVVRTQTQEIFNIAEVYGLPYLEGLVSVSATFEPVSEKRVDVKFRRGILGLQRLMGYHSPEALIEKIDAGDRFLPLDFPINSDNQQGWLEVTYLDDDLRVGRGNEGNVFVLRKAPRLQ